MKNFALLVLFNLFVFSAIAQNGIQFEEGNWNALLAKAKQENKVIFMDAYTTWCGPCKKLSKEVFPLKSVGDFYNANFINAKFDMEKGEGIELAKKYNVRAYPTLLFIDGDGNMVHKGLGYRGGDDLLALGQAASDPKTQLGSLMRGFENGEQAPAEMAALTAALSECGENYSAVMDAYLGTSDNWDSPEMMDYLFKYTNNLDSRAFKHMVEKKTVFVTAYGEEKVNSKFQSVMSQALYAKDVDINKMGRTFREIFPDNHKEYFTSFKSAYFLRNKEYDRFAENAVYQFREFPPTNWNQYNSAAWVFYERIEDEKLLKTALGWAKKSVELDKNFYNMDTMAALYYKLGNKRQAKKTAKRAIKIAKKADQDYTDTANMLAKIKKM